MKKYATHLLLIFFIISSSNINGQELPTAKIIKAKGDYIHHQTGTVFPVIFDIYQRKEIYSFDKKKTNTGVVYENQQNHTTLSFYIYPAGDGCEGRLRKEYLKSMQSIANLSENGIHATQSAVRHEGDKYICNGFTATMLQQPNQYNSLTVFECGEWFFKVRITTSGLDSARIRSLEQKIYAQFDPAKLTALNPLKSKADVSFSKNAFRDSVLLGSAMGSAFKKIEWALENVNENERASGFPDLYLDLQIESLKAFMEFQHRFNYKKSDFTTKYLNELQLISDAGFLAEFVMDQFGMVLILPKNMTSKHEAYEAWKRKNNISIDLDQGFYIVSYGQRK